MQRSRGRIAHRNPTNHPTDWWDKVVKAIPKEPDAHAVQRDFIRDNFAKPVSRILDIGAGEGIFTETALILLLQAGKLAPRVSLRVLEESDKLWGMCEVRLCSVATQLALKGVKFTFSRVTEPQKLRRDQNELFDDFDCLQSNESTFQLVIASHVTYYFHDGGIDFAYGLITRMLAPEGHAWFVVRDRNCPFYRIRKMLLVEKGVPDVNTQQFADSFIFGLKTLFQGIKSNRRDLFLDLHKAKPGEQKKVLEYLTWLDNFGKDEIRQFMETCYDPSTGQTVYPNLGFSEQHIWICNSDKSRNVVRYKEAERLQAAHTLSRCLNSIWEIAPDASCQLVSLAEITPSGGNGAARQEKEFIQEDKSSPISFSGFNLKLFGFKNIPASASVSDPLERYFRKHTSFLYYPRFYIDHVSVCPLKKDRSAHFHTVMEQQLSGDTECSDSYVTDTGGDTKVEIEKHVLENSTFENALADWVKLTGDYYISEPEAADRWTFAVGTHLLPGGGFHFFDDPQLNSRCALFLTVSTSCDFGRLSSYVVGHIKTILTQYLAQKVYQVAQDRLRKAEKAEQLIHLMQRPLVELSNALDGMQRDTQELKSILYEPSEALFSSYSRISHLFEQGRRVELSEHLQVVVQHSADQYRSNEELRAVLCYVICCCYGKDKQLSRSESLSSLTLAAVSILSDLQQQQSLKSITRGIRFLTGMVDLSGLMSCERAKLVSLLESFKDALFTPFKLDSDKWPGIAMALLFENCPDAISSMRSQTLEMPPAFTPIRYSTVLSFLSKVHYEYSQRPEKPGVLYSLNFYCKEGQTVIEATFRGRTLFDNRKAANPGHVRQQMEQLLAVPRDWRIDHTNVGDFMASFVTLATSLLGIGTAWHPMKARENELLRLVSASDSRSFSLSIDDCDRPVTSTLRMLWSDLKREADGHKRISERS
jgi:hypothetical protein